jgi:hypothetical protein
MSKNTAEELFDVCLANIVEDDVSEQRMVIYFGDLSKEKKRVIEPDGRIFLTINGNFFRAKMFFNSNAQKMTGLVVQTDKKPFAEMRACGRAFYMQTTESPTPGGKVEWKKSILGGKEQLIMKQFEGEPLQIVVSFINIFGNYTVHFDRTPLK